MHKTIEKTDKLCALKDKFMMWAEAKCDTASITDMGAVVDMIKDLCEAEKDLWKACYYHSVVEAMEEYGEDPERYGYDNWRYASGRYAPKGKGHRSGFTDPRMWEGYDAPDGYRDGSTGMDRRGGTYDRYRDARRHYTESGKPADKDEMTHHAKMYMTEALGTFRDIWKDADPDMKASMKTQVAALAKELGI